jgi:hypothetical protein
MMMARKYRELDDDGKNKISEALSGRTFSVGHADNISRALKGRTLSEEHKRNISLGMLEYWRSVPHRFS